jgi:DNA-binding CsgD family transcriptional regulator
VIAQTHLDPTKIAFDRPFYVAHKVRLLGRYLNSGTEVKRLRDLCKRATTERVTRPRSPSGRGPARLTQQQNEQILALYEDGVRPVDIARVVGTTEWTVHHRLNRLGVKRRPIGMTVQQCREAVRLYIAGESMRQISLKIGFNDKTIKKALIEASVDVQDRRRKS